MDPGFGTDSETTVQVAGLVEPFTGSGSGRDSTEKRPD